MSETENNIPQAIPVQARNMHWVWLIPLACLGLAAFILYQQYTPNGSLIQLKAKHGHGIKEKNDLRFRGVTVGSVEKVKLQQDGEILIDVRLKPEAEHLAKTGSRFWIVRPELSLRAVRGTDAIVGPQYIAVQPGEGTPASTFTMLDEAPPGGAVEKDSLHLTLLGTSRGSLSPGDPLYYRKVEIGSVQQINLAIDGRTVEIHLAVKPGFKHFVRDNTKFWRSSGLDFDLGWKGVAVKAESLREIASGGLNMATPNVPGKKVTNGFRALLEEEEDEAWLQWRPDLKP